MLGTLNHFCLIFQVHSINLSRPAFICFIRPFCLTICIYLLLLDIYSLCLHLKIQHVFDIIMYLLYVYMTYGLKLLQYGIMAENVYLRSLQKQKTMVWLLRKSKKSYMSLWAENEKKKMLWIENFFTDFSPSIYMLFVLNLGVVKRWNWRRSADQSLIKMMAII